MERNTFWNDVCRGGAILGGMMSVSSVYEQSTLLRGSLAGISFMSIEWLAVAALFIWLLWRFTKRRASRYSAAEGFSFGQGWSFVTAVSAACGILVGAVGYIYRNLVIGNAEYIKRLTESVWGLLRESQLPAAIAEPYGQMLREMQQAPAPSILSAVSGSLMTYALTGAILGLILAGIASRAPRPFDGADTL